MPPLPTLRSGPFRSLWSLRTRLADRPVRLWCVAFAGFFLLIGSWAVAQPYDASADEHDHMYRAYGVASGEIRPEPTAAIRGTGAFQTVAKGLIRPWPSVTVGGQAAWTVEPPCWLFKRASAACAEPPSADATPVVVASGAGRYNPVYYGLVGMPLKLWPGWPGVLLARLLSAAMCAAFLAGAITAIVRYSRHGLMMAGLVASATPLMLQFMASVNPNGPEMAAGIALFAGGIPLLIGRASATSKGLLALVGLSAVALATFRPTGLLFLGMTAIMFFLPLRASNLRALWAERAVRLWVAGIILACVAAVAWIFTSKATNLGTFTFGRTLTTGEAIVGETERWGWNYLPQFISELDWATDVQLPAPIYFTWAFVAAALAIFGVVFGRGVDRWRMFAVLAGGLFVPAAVQVLSVNAVGFITQGRYLLPMLVGLLILGAYIMEERGLSAEHSHSLTRLVVGVLLVFQFLSLVFVMVRWQRGIPGQYGIGWLNPFVGAWHPVVGSATPVFASLIGLLVIGWLAWPPPVAPFP